jgi:hypothetical protein
LDRRRLRRWRRRNGKFANCAQHLAAITEDDAEIFQVLISWVAKD